MSGTMTMAQICAMWRGDAALLRTRANALGSPDGDVLAARADQIDQCAHELSVHLHTGPGRPVPGENQAGTHVHTWGPPWEQKKGTSVTCHWCDTKRSKRSDGSCFYTYAEDTS